MKRALGGESLLRLRRSLERGAQLELKKVIGEINQNKTEHMKVAAERQRLRIALRVDLRSGIPAEEMVLYSERSLDGEEFRLRHELEALESRRREAEVRYEDCRRERKILESMLDRRQAEERVESSRREQVQVDEVSLRRARTLPSIGGVD